MTSLAASRITSHHGMIDRTASATIVATMYSRSAAGSSSWPRRLCWCRARAIFPSSQSDSPAAIRIPTAHQSATWLRGPRTSHRNTGTPASRATLIMLGTVQTRPMGSGSATPAVPATLPGCMVMMIMALSNAGNPRGRPYLADLTS
jgi:hypothetical protein